jgi:hypothetical protein
VVAGTLRVPLSQPQKHHIQPERYVPFEIDPKKYILTYLEKLSYKGTSKNSPDKRKNDVFGIFLVDKSIKTLNY